MEKSSSAAYEIRNLRHRYRQGFLLDIPSLTLDRDKSYGFMGPNGSGKSTLLRMLAFIDEPDEGSIHLHRNGFADTPLSRTEKREERAEVTMLLQEPFLLRRSVYENVAYGLRIRGQKREMREKVYEALNMVGLDPAVFAHRRSSELSGGEAQRVALAARLVLKPDILILDEPTASVDRVSAQMIREAIGRVRDTYRSTLLVASHDLVWLHEVSDEILKMHEGIIVGSEEDNFIPGPWSPGESGLWYTILADGRSIWALKPPSSNSIALLSTVSTIVTTKRPDHVSAQNVLSGRLVHMYTVENSERVELDVQVSDLSLNATVTRKAVGTLGLMPGMEVWVVFKASSLQWQ
jgi:tungstate transport system ATP-binding protein